MTADAFGSILGFIQQATGNNNNNWGTTFNNSFATPGERAIAGVNVITAVGGTVDLSTVVPPAGLRLDIDHVQLLNGALTSDLTVKVPNISKTWWFENDTSGAFQVFVQVPSGASPNGLVQIPQGCGIMVMCDGNGNLRRHDRAEVGSFRISGKAAAGPGEILCNGASLLKAEFPDLSNAIGTTWGSADSTHFTVPNLTDTNRFPRAGGGSGPAVGTYQSNQNLAHVHSITGSPSAGSLGTDSQGAHNHGISDPGHGHTYNVVGNIGAAAIAADGTGSVTNHGSTDTNVTGIGINSAGAHVHNITGAPGLGTIAAASQGGSEARPESAAVLICIKY